MYIAFEGIDNCGKSTQMELLRKKLKNYIYVQEPSNQYIRQLLKYDSEGFSDYVIQHLFIADRYHLYDFLYKKLYEENLHVLSDRCYISSLIYQEDIPMEENLAGYMSMNNFITPDIVFFFNLDEETYKERQKKYNNNDSFENKLKYSLNQKYIDTLEYLQKNKIIKKYYIIDANKDIESIHQDILNIFKKEALI